VCYSLWYNAPMMLPTGSLDAEEQQGHQMVMLSLINNSNQLNIFWAIPSSGTLDCVLQLEV